MPNACFHWSWSKVRASAAMSLLPRPIEIHSGWYSFLVAAFVSAAVIW